MKIPKIEIDPVNWQANISLLLEGKITRKECAAAVGLNYQTFIKRLKYEKLDDKVKAAVTHPNSGTGNVRAKEDPQRYQRYRDAVEHAIKFNSTKAAADKFDVGYQYLSRLVRAEKAARQQPKAA